MGTALEKVLLTWSGGKDSALALHGLMGSGEWQVVSLLTTVTEEFDRISMHGVRRALLEEQARSLGMPLEIVYLPRDATNEEFEGRMRGRLEEFRARGVRSVAFGDIFLEELRTYREKNLSVMGMGALFPLWKRDTGELARSFVTLGFRAVVTCVDSTALSGEFVGREFDERFLADLPASVDPCGENGEFHSFVYDGPIFSWAVAHSLGETVIRDERFHFRDLLPLDGSVAG
jgi:uncharacterized protein (TIGR00290 family)